MEQAKKGVRERQGVQGEEDEREAWWGWGGGGVEG